MTPSVVVVKKVYKQRRRRKWKLKTMADGLEEMDAGNDRETFMRDLEDDAEYREQVDIFLRDDLSMASEATLEDAAPGIPYHLLIRGGFFFLFHTRHVRQTQCWILNRIFPPNSKEQYVTLETTCYL